MAKPHYTDSFRVQTIAYVCRNEIHEITMQCRSAKSFVDDLGLSRGVVPSRAAAILRSIETKPFDSVICPLDGRTDGLITETGRRRRLA